MLPSGAVAHAAQRHPETMKMAAVAVVGPGLAPAEADASVGPTMCRAAIFKAVKEAFHAAYSFRRSAHSLVIRMLVFESIL
jgi:hypothetical protein